MPVSNNGSVNTRTETYNNARWFSLSNQSVQYGMCLMWSRTMADIGAKYPSAIVAARHAPRRMGTPPAGTFVYWSSKTYGHIAISAGGGYVYSTDYPRRNHVGRVKITTLTRRWKLRYIGWSDECNDVRLKANPRPKPKPKPKPKPHVSKDVPRPKNRTVYLSKIKPGQHNSNSVYWIQLALNRTKLKGGRRLTLTGTYGPETKAMVKLLQAQKFNSRVTGDLNSQQVRHLLKLTKLKVTLKERP